MDDGNRRLALYVVLFCLVAATVLGWLTRLVVDLQRPPP